MDLTTRPIDLRRGIEHLSASQRAARADVGVLLVSMPFASARRPSLQIGLLAAIARGQGFRADTAHLGLELADQLGLERYEALCEHRGLPLGDWIFSTAAFGTAAPDPSAAFLDRCGTGVRAQLEAVEATLEDVRRLRDEGVETYLDRVMEDVDWSRYQVVGFTCTFAQSVASFALARRLADAHPNITCVFGGSNFDGEMGLELVRTVPVIDLAVSGEADLAFPELLVALAEGRDPTTVPGVIGRRRGSAPGEGTEDGEVAATPARPPFERLDDLPTPAYEEYFERAERLGLLPVSGRREVMVPFESARGCWWGEKRHCTFCGLNGSTMAFRAKSPERVHAELAELAYRCRSFDFTATDNIIEPTYLDTLLPRLTADESTYRLFYEVKANLDRDTIARLAAAGVSRIQPGIESLSSRVLARMRKGTRAWQNVNLLRWCRHHHVAVGWNLLYGFPGETQAEYDDQVTLLRNVVHLAPPAGSGRIWMERFSPLYTEREAFGVEWFRPQAGYPYVYPTDVDLDRVAYFFDYGLADTLDDDAFAPTVDAIDAWIAAWDADQPPALTLWSAPGFIQIGDERDDERSGIHSFTDPLASIYLACSDTARTAAGVKERLGLPHDVVEVTEVLDEFVARGLMMRDGNLFLALAVPARAGHGAPSKVRS